MKPININEKEHEQLKIIAKDYQLPMTVILSVAILKFAEELPTCDSKLTDIIIDKARFVAALKIHNKPIPEFIVLREINRQKGYDVMTMRDCCQALLIMVFDGDIECNEDMLYSIPGDAGPI